MAVRIGWVERIQHKKRTSIGNSARTKPTNKSKKRMTKPKVGQG